MITTKLNLSVIILTNRTDQLFVEAVSSVNFAKQVLVIELGTTNSKELQQLATKHGFDLVSLPINSSRVSNFSQVRNQSLEHATYDWVLFLDSDEQLDKSSIPAIASIIDANRDLGIWVKRQDIFYGKKLRFGEAGGQWILRMGLKKSLKFFRPVHEVAELSGDTFRSSITITHYAHESISEFIAKVAYYAKIDAYFRVEQGDTFSLLELLVYPPAKFFVSLFIRFGFLDGWRGFVYALVMSLHSLFVRVYQYQATISAKN